MKKILSLSVFMLLSILVHSQVSNNNPPKIIFMKLEESYSKIEAMKKRNINPDKIESVKEVDREINISMLKDFKDNFTFCTVYFFYASDLEKLIEKRFNEIEFYDWEHYQLNKKISIENAQDYLIAEIGYQPEIELLDITDRKVSVKHINFEGTQDHVGGRDYGILLYDETYKLLKHRSIHWVNISLKRVGNIFKPSTMKYRFLGAKTLDKKLRNYFLRS